MQLAGTIELSGDNSDLTEKSFIVGAGIKATIITLTSPKALLQASIVVQPEGTLVLNGTQDYTTSKDITVKSGDFIDALKRFILSNNAILI